jgi:hypothetical protein
MLSVRRFVFAGALLAVVPFAAVAQEKKAEPKAMPAAPAAAPALPGAPVPGPGGACPPAPCAPATMKVCQMVPTQCQETRTVMKQVQKQECYTAYRTETVQEKKVVPVTTYKTVTETVMETRTHCVKVPCWEEKTCMEKRKKVEWVTEYKEKCHLTFHKECKTIGFGGCGEKSCGGCDTGCGGCNTGCDTGCCNKGFSFSFPVCKPCLEKTCEPCCVPKCTWECVPVTKKVCTWKTETKTECVPVCKTRCVPCTENKEVTCCKQVCVPYQATRCVTECVPVQETVTVCKMVPTWVEVPCPAPCAPAAPCGPQANGCPQTNACNPCDNGCGNNGCGNNGCGNWGHGCCLFDKVSGCCDTAKSCVSGCCDKVGSCFSGFSCNVCDTFAGCCSKIKCCIPSCHINLCSPCCK